MRAGMRTKYKIQFDNVDNVDSIQNALIKDMQKDKDVMAIYQIYDIDHFLPNGVMLNAVLVAREKIFPIIGKDKEKIEQLNKEQDPVEVFCCCSDFLFFCSFDDCDDYYESVDVCNRCKKLRN